MEPEVKLFGTKFMLTESTEASDEGADRCCDLSSGESRGSDDGDKNLQLEEGQVTEISETNMLERNELSVSPEDESLNPETETPNDSRSESNATKTLKKPDKILPCPRCNSMNTKFCYYNNYNINQPRHFCKSCQRYWTAGGTMRNLPVGAGRRRSKNSAPSCRHITISEALSVSRIDDSRVLSFTPDESIASGLNQKGAQIKEVPSSSHMSRDSNPNINGFPVPPPVHCVPWPYPPIYPMPFIPTPYWNCAVPPNPWIVPLLPVFSEQNGNLGIPESGNACEQEKSLGNGIVVPKTLRVDDPEEAAKSSIWKTLGINYDSLSREGLFKALQSKDQKENALPQTLQANPAALSRSITFQETA